MNVQTELKNTSAATIVAKYDGAELVFEPGQVRNLAQYFPAEMIPSIMYRFQVKYGLVPFVEPVVPAMPKIPTIEPPAEEPQAQEEPKPAKKGKKRG